MLLHRNTLKYKTIKSSELTDDLLSKLYQVRMKCVTLRPEVKPEEDFLRFSNGLNKSDTITCLYEQSGAYVGLFSLRFLKGNFQGTPYLVIFFGNVALLKEHRGSPTLILAAVINTVSGIVRAGWRAEKLFAGGHGFPTAYLSLARIAKTSFLYGERGNPPLIEFLMRRIIDEIIQGHWDPKEDRFLCNFVPDVTEHWLERFSDNSEYKRYLGVCPRWQEGYGTVFVFDGFVDAMKNNITKTIRRLIRS